MNYRTYSLVFICGISCCAFVVLARLAHARPYFSWDVRWLLMWQAIDVPTVAPLMVALTWLGDNFAYWFMVTLSAGGFIFLGRGRDAIAIGATVVGSELFTFSIKTLVKRPRPSLAGIYTMREVLVSSFPSGHVMRFVVFFGFLISLTYSILPEGAVHTMILVFFGLLLLGIGLSRIYVGEHWPSDVLGGYLIGLCWLSLALLLYNHCLSRFA